MFTLRSRVRGWRGDRRPRLIGPALNRLEDRLAPAQLVVTSSLDDGSAGTLRSIVAIANTNSEADTITFDPATFSSQQTITLSNGEIPLTNTLTIEGPVAPLTISGNKASRIFNASSAASNTLFAISKLTLTDVNVTTGSGGAILGNNQNFNLISCRLVNNSVLAGDGGAVSVRGLTATDCEFANNSASATGGAIRASSATLTRCQVSENKAASAGGLFLISSTSVIEYSSITNNIATGTGINGFGGGLAASSTLTIRNSTFSGNTANTSGGGLLFSGALMIQNSTIVDNIAGTSGGGIVRTSGTSAPTLTSNIIAANKANVGPDLSFNSTTKVAGSNNLIGVADAGNFTLTGTDNLTGSLATPLNPLLEPLAKNGGATLSHNLKANSPAIDAGLNASSSLFDQRGYGFLRRIDDTAVIEVSDGTDIGAMEIGQVSNPTDGKFDPTFGIDGKVIQRFPYPDSEGCAVKIDSAGRIVVAGATNDGTKKVFAITRLLSNGSLDLSFNGSGKVMIAFGKSDDYASGVAIDSMGRIVVVGSTFNGIDHDFAVARLLDNGLLDPSFNGSGKLTFSFGTGRDNATAVAIDSSSRINICGYAVSPETNKATHFAMARLSENGSFDNNFDGDGRKVAILGGQSYAYGLTIDSLGRLVVGGYIDPGATSSDFCVIRVLPDGSLDPFFNGSGQSTVDVNEGFDRAYAITVDAMDRPVIGGKSDSSMAIARLTVDGQPDVTFDSDGQKLILIGGHYDTIQGIIVDSNQRIVLSGYSSNDTGIREFVVARLNNQGAFDQSFSGDGLVTFAGASAQNGAPIGAAAVAFDNENRIVVGGTSLADLPGPTMTVVRLTDSGQLDLVFGDLGQSHVEFLTNSYANARSVAIDHQGRIVVAGNSSPGNGGTSGQFGISRYLPNGVLDVGFGTAGTATFNFFQGLAYQFEVCASVAIDALDRIVVGGYFANSTNSDMVVVRLTPSGNFDSAFGNNGRLMIDVNGGDDTLSEISFDSLDRIVIAGHTFNGAQDGIVAVRLTPYGELDWAFGTGGKSVFGFSTAAYMTSSAVAVDLSDRIVIVGRTGSSSSEVGVARLTTSGVLDASFAGTGATTFWFDGKSSTSCDVALDAMGRIVVAGHISNSKNSFGVARLTPEGILDTTFDRDGTTTFGFGSTVALPFSVLVDLTNRIVVSGYHSVGSGLAEKTQVALARLSPKGFLDPNFNGIGQVTFDYGDSRAIAFATVLDSQNRIVITGSTSVLRSVNAENSQFILARLFNDEPSADIAKVSSVTINDGSTQRSRVTSLKITFNQLVTLPADPAGAFELRRQNDNALPALTATAEHSLAGTVVTLTFSGMTSVDHGSLADGRYTLFINAAKLNGGYFDGNSDGVAGDDHVLVGNPANGLFRLFGDSNGDGRVNVVDWAAFRGAFGSASSIFDFNNDGVTNAVDFAQFRARFGVVI